MIILFVFQQFHFEFFSNFSLWQHSGGLWSPVRPYHVRIMSLFCTFPCVRTGWPGHGYMAIWLMGIPEFSSINDISIKYIQFQYKINWIIHFLPLKWLNPLTNFAMPRRQHKNPSKEEAVVELSRFYHRSDMTLW